MATKVYRINHQIQAPTVRLLAADGSQIGVMPIEEARAKASATKEDLVEIASSANPPVVKLINFKKFKYQEAKKEREAAKNVKKVELKEIRLTPFMGENDFNIRMERVKEFLSEGNKVRLVVRFTGRQMSKAAFGFGVLKKAFEALKEISAIDQEPKLIGRQLIGVITPTKREVKE